MKYQKAIFIKAVKNLSLFFAVILALTGCQKGKPSKFAKKIDKPVDEISVSQLPDKSQDAMALPDQDAMTLPESDKVPALVLKAPSPVAPRRIIADDIKDEKDKDTSLKKIRDKITKMASFYKELPYQNWEPSKKISKEKSIVYSLTFFFSELKSYFKDERFSADKVALFKGDDYEAWMDFGFLGVTADSISEVQMSQTEEKSYSIKTLIEAAFEMKEGYQQGILVPSWVPIVLEYEREALTLLQFRHVFSVFLFGQSIAPDKFKGLSHVDHTVDSAKTLFRSNEISLKEIQTSQLNQAIEYLEKAKQTRNFLKKIGVKPVWPSTLRDMIFRFHIKEFKRSYEKRIHSKEHTRFETLYKDLKNDMVINR